MANFYSNETPTGLVNGVNTDFTTEYNINTIITVTIDGAVYTGDVTYTPDTKSFSVADAPTVSITVSYFDSLFGAVVSDGMTVSALRTAFQRRKQDISDVGVSEFYDWCDEINKYIYENVKDNNVNSYISTGHYFANSFPSTQALPSDFMGLTGLDCGVYYVDTDGVPTSEKLPITGYGSTMDGYYIQGSNIIFTGNAVSNRYALRYLPVLSDITASDDTMLLTSRFKRYMIDALDVCYSIWDDDIGAEISADQRFVRSLSHVLGNIDPLPPSCSIDTPYNIY